MPSIKSPYNFVPLSEKVVFADWADRISMDVPFQDGISGTLDIEVKAETPIYIRNGGYHPADQEKKRQSPEYQDFFRVTPQGRYAIPGTSLKGVLRQVLKIVAFGKLDQVDDHRYSVRDLRNQQLYTSRITENTPNGYRPKTKAGWLSKEGDDWYLTPCSFSRVEQEDLEGLAAAQGKRIFLGERMGAVKKYDRWEKAGMQLQIRFTPGPETAHRHSCGNLAYSKAENLGRGNKDGVIVFTGQPSKRDGKPRKKHLEFIFHSEDPSKRIRLDKNLVKDFEFIHSDPDGSPNEEWKFWKRRLKEGGRVPVFYLTRDGKPASMGLAMMYRLAYDHTVHDAIRHTSPDHLDPKRLDLAEAVFGFVLEEKGEKGTEQALRGRVSIGLLEAQGEVKKLPTVRAVLNSPKPTFYPNYIEQPGGEYKTFMDKDCRLRGWKRYPVRPYTGKVKTATENTDTFFTPLPQGTVFAGRIHVHNLKPVELGGLCWALTFGGRSDLCHSVGMAKPYGFGAVKITVKAHNLVDNQGKPVTPDEAVKAFEAFMNGKVSNWKDTPQMKEFLAMANMEEGKKRAAGLEYPLLDDQGNNEFVDYKKAKWKLDRYTAFQAAPAPDTKGGGGFHGKGGGFHGGGGGPRHGGHPQKRF